MLDSTTHNILLAWAKWARGNGLPREFMVRCQSIESHALAEAGEVNSDTSERLFATLAASAKRIGNDPQCERVEIIVMRLPHRNRDALRLSYVVGRAMPLTHKLRLLGVSYDGYRPLVSDSAAMVRYYLTPIERELARRTRIGVPAQR